MPGVVFFGYGDLATTALDVLDAAAAPLAAVVVPGNRTGADVDLVRAAAGRRGLPLLVQQTAAPHSESFTDRLAALEPDVMIIWSYSMRLPPAVLALPRAGTVNVHGGPLPEFRGGHVAQWALVTGAREFGVTLHYVDDGLDTGPIIAATRFPLDPLDDALSLREKIRRGGSELLARWWPAVYEGRAPRTPQDESRARYWPLRTVADGAIAWTMPVESIERLVRALRANTPGAYVDTGGGRVSIRQVRARRAASAAGGTTSGLSPGQVIAVDAGGVRVGGADGELLVLAAECDGAPLDAGQLAALLGDADA